MDGRAGGWMDSGLGWSQDKRGLLLHATALYLDWTDQRQSWGVGLRAGLGSVSQGKELGSTHLDLDD